jgi:hypothetical protein
MEWRLADAKNRLAWISTENYSPKCEAGFRARATWSNAMIAHSTRAH